MSYSSVILADSPVAWWRLGEASGTTAADSIGSNHGTIAGGPTMGVAGCTPGDTAITFTGSNKVTTGSNTPYVGTGAFSIEAWFKTSTTAPWYGGQLFDNKGGSNGVRLHFTDVDVIARIGALGADGVVTKTVAYADGLWHHVVVVRALAATDLCRFYYDGALVGSAPITGMGTGYNFAGSFAFKIGQGGDYFTGSIDEVAVYNSELSAGQVAAHYAAATGGDGAPAGIPALLLGV